MNSKKENYIRALKGRRNLVKFLLKESNLPGPRANIELAQALSEVADEKIVLALLKFEEELAPKNDPNEFLCFCGVMALGNQILLGKDHYFNRLKIFSSDARWRIREAVAMALQAVGRKDMSFLIENILPWSEGNLFERRAVVAALCEPSLLTDKNINSLVLKIVNEITQSLLNEDKTGNEGFRVLRKALGYCWSIIIIACPEEGKKLFESLRSIDNEDFRWIVSENLKKKRLKNFDPVWVNKMSEK